MSAKEPELQDFGITAEEYEFYNTKDTGPSSWDFFLAVVIVFSVNFAVSFVITRDLGIALAWGFLGSIIPFPGLAMVAGLAHLFNLAVVRFKRFRLLAGPVGAQIKLYEAASAAYEEAERIRLEAESARWEPIWAAVRQQVEAEERAERERQQAEQARLRMHREYWMGLSGAEFEQELAALFERRGYRVESTPTTGDGGIDIIARKAGKTTIVQCKRYKSPVGVSVARDLYGTLVSSSADRAILACTGGFTKGVKDFVEGKPITLVDAWDIIKVAESIR